MLTLLLATGIAHASGLHAGIPVHGVPGLSDPSFQTPDLGWTATVPGGWARLYVGRDEADASRWYHQQLDTLQVEAAPCSGFGDECAGDGDALFAFRDGNVGVLLRVDRGARTVGEGLRAAIVDGPAWPSVPTVVAQPDGTYTVVVSDAVHVDTSGGVSVPYRPGVYRSAPTTVVAWDAYGRPAVWRVTEAR